MKVSKDFYLQEFVPPDIYNKFGNNAIWFIDPKIIRIAQFLRDRFKQLVVINNWLFAGEGAKYKYSGFDPPVNGFRPPDSLSQHRFGRAIDVKFSHTSIQEVANDIKNNFKIYKDFGLTTIENPEFTKTWLHIDTRFNNNSDFLLIVNP